MGDYGRAVRQQLREAGCWLVRHGKGDHEIWRSPVSNRNITVDTVIKSRHTANEIMKQAGLAYRFR